MTHFFQVLVAVGLFAGFQSQASASVDSCRNMGSYVCAVDSRTGQCTNSWSNRGGDNGMFHCRNFIGQGRSNYNPSNYVCSRTTNGVCARSLSTGQCTNEWRTRDGGDPMFFCKKHLGQSVSNWNPRNYVCRATTNGACAQSIRTGQCTNSWSRQDTHDPMATCLRFLN